MNFSSYYFLSFNYLSFSSFNSRSVFQLGNAHVILWAPYIRPGTMPYLYETIIYLTLIRTPCSQENGDIVSTSKVHMYLKSLLKYLLVFLLYNFSNNIHSKYNHFSAQIHDTSGYSKKHFGVSAVLLESEPFEEFLMHVSLVMIQNSANSYIWLFELINSIPQWQ